jgi:TDG/mug DNA glycosylase family protein
MARPTREAEGASKASVASFAPVAGPDARVLVLGSMPGVRSLQAHAYYAHPRNRFWDYVGEALGVDATAPYRERLRMLVERRVALWDVLGRCERVGSLDASIVPSSMEMNDLRAFFGMHRDVRTVLLNGSKAAALWKGRVAPTLTDDLARVRWEALPSTSPANASIPETQKRAAWVEALRRALE